MLCTLIQIFRVHIKYYCLLDFRLLFYTLNLVYSCLEENSALQINVVKDRFLVAFGCMLYFLLSILMTYDAGIMSQYFFQTSGTKTGVLYAKIFGDHTYEKTARGMRAKFHIII